MEKSNKIFDGLLVLQYRSGNQKALSLLVNRYHLKLCRHSYWYTHDAEVAKDIVQDCWGIMANKLSGLKDPNSFGSWATRIVTRKSLDYLEKGKKTRENLEVYSKTAQPYETQENTSDREADILRLQKAIKQLPKDQQIVIRLFYTEEYSLKEMSGVLDVSVGTIKSRLFHAREKLKSILKNK
ncbi:RNA polymerase sigma factor [Spongiimicrobium sp. 3-5]|uniref:RNA polymerase sigma factor n=1 Tax=Spongiimicrobium sp. 3-5 TaxID=3332596 RepID=UPI00397F99F9